MKGKAYANRKLKAERPESDFYRTPESLTRELIKLNILDRNTIIHEPAAGDGAIVTVLKEEGFSVTANDIRVSGVDFLTDTTQRSQLVTNPPFSLFDDFVLHAQEICDKRFIMLAKTNFFGAYGRHQAGVWKHLKHVYIFNRQVDYRTPRQPKGNGNFHVGNLITGWFVWDKTWTKDYWKTSILDVQQYATLGAHPDSKKEKLLS